MAKIIKQDGQRRVFIYDDGSEVSFDKVNTTVSDKPKKVKKKKKDIKPIDDSMDEIKTIED